jgi:nucleotide-binding universal stress UspA family protein
MYRRILIPVDRSTCSHAAMEHGLNLAHEHQAEVRIIHIIDTQSLHTYEGVNVEPVETAWRRAGQEILDRAEECARAAGLAAVTVALVETRGRRIASAIVAECERWPADLILMGTHGRHGIEHALLGSVAEGVIRTAPVPVLLFRAQGPCPEPSEHPRKRVILGRAGRA